MSALRDQTAALLKAEMDHLGDEITYTPQGGSAVTFNAWVTFGAEHFNSPGSAATKATPQVEVRAADVPNPSVQDRLTIALRPGALFAPVDILDGETGETWVLPLKKVAS